MAQKKTAKKSVEKAASKKAAKKSSVRIATEKKTAKKGTSKKTAKKSSVRIATEKKTVKKGTSKKAVSIDMSVHEAIQEQDEAIFTITPEETIDTNVDDRPASEEQTRYATILHYLSLTGLLLLVVGFFIYLWGILPSTVPASEIPNYWRMSAHDYIRAAGVHTGWSWLGFIGNGNVVSFASLTFLAFVSIMAFIGTLPIYIKKKDTYYTVIVSVQILVLLLAASGLITVGGH